MFLFKMRSSLGIPFVLFNEGDPAGGGLDTAIQGGAEPPAPEPQGEPNPATPVPPAPDATNASDGAPSQPTEAEIQASLNQLTDEQLVRVINNSEKGSFVHRTAELTAKVREQNAEIERLKANPAQPAQLAQPAQQPTSELNNNVPSELAALGVKDSQIDPDTGYVQIGNEYYPPDIAAYLLKGAQAYDQAQQAVQAQAQAEQQSVYQEAFSAADVHFTNTVVAEAKEAFKGADDAQMKEIIEQVGKMAGPTVMGLFQQTGQFPTPQMIDEIVKSNITSYQKIVFGLANLQLKSNADAGKDAPIPVGGAAATEGKRSTLDMTEAERDEYNAQLFARVAAKHGG